MSGYFVVSALVAVVADIALVQKTTKLKKVTMMVVVTSSYFTNCSSINNGEQTV